MMKRQGEIILPSYSSDNDLANRFSDLSTENAGTIRETLVNNGASITYTAVMRADVKFKG